MANTQAICTSFKVEVLRGIHALGTSVVRAGTGADTIKGALYLASATMNAGSTAYTATGEASGTGYTAGGATVTNGTAPTSSGTTAFWTPSAALSWAGLTLATAVDAVLLYNDTQSGDPAIGVFTFGSLTITAGTLTISFPVNDASTGLVRIA
jgi:hypothetical protein